MLLIWTNSKHPHHGGLFIFCDTDVVFTASTAYNDFKLVTMRSVTSDTMTIHLKNMKVIQHYKETSISNNRIMTIKNEKFIVLFGLP